MYDPKSMDANEFISHEEVEESLAEARVKAADPSYVRELLDKAAKYKGLTHREAAVLLNVESPEVLNDIYTLARNIKEHIYGRRIVMFAPLYVSDYCVNHCSYCGYAHNHCIKRRKLTQEEVAEEVRVLEGMGHKRLALEAGEDPVNCSIDYIIECMKTIYSLNFDNGSIRRINVQIAATTVENFRKLKEAGIGTYILFQETYHKPTYLKVHGRGPKHNYEWHTEAHGRAMEGGIDDVGIGVLYGLYDWRYETVAMLMAGEHLEAAYGVGPHTISVPRIRAAKDVKAEDFPYLASDDDFRKIVAVLRLAVPYTGMILSTREPVGFREEIIALGISQVSAGSATGVGGYAYANKLGQEEEEIVPQFEIEDQRSPREVLKGLMEDGYIPSYCTACYREGRTGDRFMRLAKTGEIKNVCQPNAIVTLKEYIEDYGDDEMKAMGDKIIERELASISNPKVVEKTREYLDRIKAGERDMRF
ncbi:MAG: [FeFe] hydrogenase H-cluster radical SAM maturase HydG [Armatimonadota bacterium]